MNTLTLSDQILRNIRMEEDFRAVERFQRSLLDMIALSVGVPYAMLKQDYSTVRSRAVESIQLERAWRDRFERSLASVRQQLFERYMLTEQPRKPHTGDMQQMMDDLSRTIR